MTTAPPIECPSTSEMSCPDACDDATAEGAVQANARFGLGRTLLALLLRSEPEITQECPTGA
jgi:hypothetical protein